METVTDDYRRTIAILKKVGPVKLSLDELSNVDDCYLSMELVDDGHITLSAQKPLSNDLVI